MQQIAALLQIFRLQHLEILLKQAAEVNEISVTEFERSTATGLDFCWHLSDVLDLRQKNPQSSVLPCLRNLLL